MLINKICLVFAWMASLFVSYKIGKAGAKIKYAKDDEGYIDYEPKECRNCIFYLNADEWVRIYHQHDWGDLSNFCDTCVRDGKKFFKRKGGQDEQGGVHINSLSPKDIDVKNTFHEGD